MSRDPLHADSSESGNFCPARHPVGRATKRLFIARVKGGMGSENRRGAQGALKAGARRTATAAVAALVLAWCAPSTARAAGASWWQRETALSAEGRLDMRTKPWWPRAQALTEGERFTLDLNGDGHPDTIVARLDGDIVEAIDTTGHAADIWNKASTTYVVSYKGLGPVDRMVSYIDDDRASRASEVELRYFRDGYLRFAWFGRSYGGDASRIFAMKHWEYAGNDQGSEFRGNTQIYINKYDPVTRQWLPLSECPFSFWDPDHDGRTDVTLRVSATPGASGQSGDTDYANHYDYMWAKDAVPLRDMQASNMRLSFNIDARPRHEPVDRPHSNFSFTMVGHEAYAFAGMRDFDANRPFPQTTIHMPWSARWTPALNYSADKIGFSWDEARTNYRWEGQFWIYEREYLSNTGSPNERWNMRREYDGTAGTRPAIYFSGADRRYHLRGAQEGWMEIGHIVDQSKDLELRWWDSNGDGYLDTMEVYRGDSTHPIWTEHFNPAPRPAALDVNALASEYNGKVLPDAIAEDRATIAALTQHVSDALAAKYEQAALGAADEPERERFCLDIASLLYYLKLRDLALSAEAENPYDSGLADPARYDDPKAGDGLPGHYTLGDSVAYWTISRILHQLDQEYANGDFHAFRITLKQLSIGEDENGQSR